MRKKIKIGKKQRKKSINKIKRLLQPLKTFKKFTIVIIIGTIISAAIGTFSAKVMSNFIGAIENKDIQLATKMFQIFWIVIVATYLIKFSKKIIYGYFSSNINIFMDTTYMKKFLLLDNNYVEKIGTAQLNSIVRKGISAQVGIMSSIITTWVHAIITIIMAFILIGIYNEWRVNIAILGVFILFAKIRFDGYREIGIFRKIRRDVYIRQDRNFIKIFMSKFEILQDQKNKYETQKYKETLPLLKKSYLDGTKKEFIHIDTANILIDIARMTLLFFTGRGVLWDTMTIAMLILYTYLLNMVISALSSINSITATLTEQFIFVEKLRETFDKSESIQNYTHGSIYQYKNGTIKLDKINYSIGWQTIFQNFSLNIPWGKITAIVWTSWSWKSTIAKMIAGYLHPDSGGIRVDNNKLKDTKLTSFYDKLGYLTQDPSIFDGTVLENITYASKGEVPEEKIHQAIKDAQCDFVYDFPNGLETEVGEKGTLLSGGQRQRLAIAKILIKNPDIIILDEPTSALDSFSEHEVTKIFYEKFKNKTILVIAHRLQTVIEADEIVVLNRSFNDQHKQIAAQVIQRGTHRELLQEAWTYAYMYALQVWQEKTI